MGNVTNYINYLKLIWNNFQPFQKMEGLLSVCSYNAHIRPNSPLTPTHPYTFIAQTTKAPIWSKYSVIRYVYSILHSLIERPISWHKIHFLNSHIMSPDPLHKINHIPKPFSYPTTIPITINQSNPKLPKIFNRKYFTL